MLSVYLIGSAFTDLVILFYFLTIIYVSIYLKTLKISILQSLNHQLPVQIWNDNSNLKIKGGFESPFSFW